MLRKHWKTATFMIAGLGLMAPAQGDQITDMQAQIDALRAELSQVKTQQGDNWLNERRAEEVKGLIMEVLSDADTRASLLNDGAVAGHDGKHFFIASADGAFAMYISGQIDFRYIWNQQDDNTSGDKDETGFQTRYMYLNFDGHVSSPKIKYHVQLGTDRGDGNVYVQEYTISNDLNDNLTITGGLMKAPFLREELISTTKQLAVERSVVNEFFTLNYVEGVKLTYGEENWVIDFMFSDGSNSGVSDFDQDSADYALTVRGDIALEGDLKQGREFTGWSGEARSIVLGGAFHYEQGDANNGGVADYQSHTVDLSYKDNGFNAYAAYIGGTVDPDVGSDRDMTGFVAQAGLHIVPDKFEIFGVWGYLDGGVSGQPEANIYTLGCNYYINGQNAKFTADVIWLGDDLPTANPFGADASSSTLGLITGTKDEMAVRTQFQLLF